MAEKETTVIQGELISSKFDFEDRSDYSLILFVREKTTKDHINVRYEEYVEGKKRGDYYKNCYNSFLNNDYISEHNPKLQLTITGGLEKDKVEYEGTGLIKLLSEDWNIH